MALNGMYTVNIANFVLNSLQKKLSAFLSVFATNVSDQIVNGSSVDVAIVGTEGAAVDLGDYSDDRTNVNVSPEFSTTKKTVTLNQKPARGFYVDPWEAAKAQDGVLVASLQRKIENVTGAVALSVVEYVLNLVTTANFSNEKVINAAAFDIADVFSLRTQADGLEWGADDGALVLASAIWQSLCDDGAILDKSQSGSDTLNSGNLPVLAGFNTMKNTRVPPVGGTPADQKLRGFAALPSAIAVAMRPLSATEAFGMLPGDFGLAHEEALFDPEANVACTMTIWGAANTKRLYHCVESWYGAAVAMADQLIRVRE